MITDYNQYRSLWDNVSNALPDIPLSTDIELSSVCNLKCFFCPQSTVSKKFYSKFMDISLFKKIIDDCYNAGIPSIKLNLRGESTLHPDFFEACNYCIDKFIDIRLNTNGNYDLSLNNIMAKTFHEVCFSIDAFSEKTYKKIRVNGDFKLLHKNIELFYRLKLGKMKMSFVTTKDNSHELESFASWAKGNYPDCELFIRNVARRTDGDYVCDGQVAVGRKDCLMPSRRVVIASDGAVFPCCVSPWDEKLVMGYYNGDVSVVDFFKSGQFNDLRKLLKNNRAFNFGACKNCYSRESYTWS